MKGNTIWALIISLGIATALSHSFVDTGLALLVEDLFHNRLTLQQRQVPDYLFWFVCAATAGSLAGHLALRKVPRFQRLSSCFGRYVFVLPAVYAAKEFLKWTFGRVNSRVWLSSRETTAFHFFQGGDSWCGFPSGHMAVFTALAVVARRHFPRSCRWSIPLLLVLAAAMVLTGYHFLSDILAGILLGLLAEFPSDRMASSVRRDTLKR